MITHDRARSADIGAGASLALLARHRARFTVTEETP
jgi:hypothetical protein